jgi:hypothetical protein
VPFGFHHRGEIAGKGTTAGTLVFYQKKRSSHTDSQALEKGDDLHHPTIHNQTDSQHTQTAYEPIEIEEDVRVSFTSVSPGGKIFQLP